MSEIIASDLREALAQPGPTVVVTKATILALQEQIIQLEAVTRCCGGKISKEELEAIKFKINAGATFGFTPTLTRRELAALLEEAQVAVDLRYVRILETPIVRAAKDHYILHGRDSGHCLVCAAVSTSLLQATLEG